MACWTQSLSVCFKCFFAHSCHSAADFFSSQEDPGQLEYPFTARKNFWCLYIAFLWVPKECFLEAFKYLKTSKQHPFETPGVINYFTLYLRIIQSVKSQTHDVAIYLNPQKVLDVVSQHMFCWPFLGRPSPSNICLFVSASCRFRFDLLPELGDEQRVQLPHPEILEALKQGSQLLLDDSWPA